MEDNIQDKQAYLRENVLEKAYDADEFMSYLQQKKGENGLDLNNWTMNELKNAVNEFIKDKDRENEPEEEINTGLNKIDEVEEEGDIITNQDTLNPNENKNQIKESVNSMNLNENNIQENNNALPNQVQENLETEKCQISEANSLSLIDLIKVKLSSPKKIDGGIFSKSFISYEVSTEPLGYKTNKRYSDFTWLRKMLTMLYSNCIIPPMCKKNFGDRFSDSLINKRMRSIEKFMQGIIEHPLVKNSELLNIFLSCEKKDEYKKRIAKYQKIKKPPTLASQMKTSDGFIKISINNEKEIYADNIRNYAQGNAYLLQKVTKAYKSLMNIMKQLSDKMKNISQLFKMILDKSLKYYDSHNTSETFNIMSNFMEDWSKIQSNQIKIMNENIREYFRYVKNEFIAFKEMAIKVKNSKTQYTKAQEKLLNTKEMLFQKQDVDLWQLKEEDKSIKLSLLNNKDLAFAKMLPNDTIRVLELKKYYGCMLNSLIEEFERIRRVNAKRHKENITNFIKALSSECTNMHICLADREADFNLLKDESDIYNIDGGISLKKLENSSYIPSEENENNIDINNKDEENNNIIDNNKIDRKNNENNKDENKKIEIKEDDYGFETIDYVEEDGNSNNKKEDKKDENKNEDNKKKEDKKENNKKKDEKKNEKEQNKNSKESKKEKKEKKEKKNKK